MPINGSGQLSVGGDVTGQSILKELDLPTTSQASLNDTALRGLAGKSSGQIAMNDFYGKADVFTFSISANQTQVNLRTLAKSAGWNESSEVVATLNSGKYIISNAVGTPALTIDGSFPNGVKLINKGYIMGKGGGSNAVNGQAGGSAISLGVNVTIHQDGGYIGGGGGCGGATSTQNSYGGGGAGAGKGNCGVGAQGGNQQGGRKLNPTSNGGAGKSVTRSGSNSGESGATGDGGFSGGGGSCRTYSIKQTSHTNQGNYIGNCSYSTYYQRRGDAGGGGGGWGASGGRGASSGAVNNANAGVTANSGSGGTNSSSGGGASISQSNATITYSSGGAGGKAVQRNGKTVTWIGGTSQVYGAVS